jgi:hypothetical protein
MIYQDIITEQEFLELSKKRNPCISIYMTTSHLLQNIQADRLRFRSLFEKTLEQLHKTKRSVDIDLIEQRLLKLLNDDNFWILQGKSLCVLVSTDQMITYRLPYDIANIAKASDRFYLKPLLPSLHPQNILVLTISQKSVNLYKYTSAEELKVIDVPQLPADLTDATGRVLQKNGVSENKLRDDSGKKVLQLQFVRAIEKAIKPIVSAYNLPLVVATTEEIFSLYKTINTYHLLSNYLVVGSVENISDEELKKTIIPVAKRIRNKTVEKWNNDFIEKTNLARTSSDLTTIAKLASLGRINKLIIDIDSAIYGTFDDQGAYKLLDAENVHSYDLLDEIVDRVMTFGGEVLPVRHSDVLPENMLPISASFRW